MKKCISAICLFTSLSLSSFSQFAESPAKIKDFIKLWGLLKYHHPAVASGKIDWDVVFVNNIQEIIDSKTKKAFNDKLLSILNLLGQPPKIQSPLLPDSLFGLNKTDINWMVKSQNLNFSIKNQLKYIYRNGNPSTNRYIRIANNTADFSGENKYDSIGFPDLRYRLLFFSRFWNIINYFSPYKYLAANWDNILEILIPRIINSTDSLSYYTTLQQLSKSLNDGHSQLVMNEKNLSDIFFGSYTPPFYCEILDGQVIIRDVGNDSIAKALNISRGDLVQTLDGKALASIIAYRRKYISASNQMDESHQLSRFILDGNRPAATIEIKRGKEVTKVAIARISTQNRDWRKFINYTSNEVGYKKLNDTVLLVYAMQIWNGNIDTIKHLIRQSKAVIFDVRNYPQNDAFYLIADPFLSEPKIIDYSTVALPQFPSLFKWEANLNKIGHESDSAYKGKVIILCDERTQSQGEYACMVLQTIPHSITIGIQTAGADGVVTNIPMGNGLNISYSGYGVYYPDKTQTQRVGIKINIPVKKKIIAIRDNKDQLLERALQFIKTGK